MGDNLIDQYLAYTEPFKGSKRYHTWSILSAGAALLERRVWLPLGGLGRIYPNMYIVLCGGPGTGKSTASNLSCGIIKAMGKRMGDHKGVQFGPDKVTPAALIKKFTGAIRTITAETGENFEQSAMYLHSTELGTMIKDIGGGSLADDLLKFYDNDDYFEKELIGMGNIKITGPCLNFLGDTTPSFLSGYLPREESGTGLTARIIFATELGMVPMDDEVPDGDKTRYERIINHMRRMYDMSGSFRVHPDARLYWKRWFERYRAELFTLPEGSYMRHFAAREPVHLRKIAMVLSAARDSGRVILQADYEKAMELLNEAKPYMDKSFGVKDFSKIDDAAKVVLDAINWAPEEISRHKLIQSLYKNGLSGAVSDLDNILLTLGEGRMIKKRVEGNVAFYSRVKID